MSGFMWGGWYKTKLACFDCQVARKSYYGFWNGYNSNADNDSCGECGEMMVRLPLEAEAPKRTRDKDWVEFRQKYDPALQEEVIPWPARKILEQ